GTRRGARVDLDRGGLPSPPARPKRAARRLRPGRASPPRSTTLALDTPRGSGHPRALTSAPVGRGSLSLVCSQLRLDRASRRTVCWALTSLGACGLADSPNLVSPRKQGSGSARQAAAAAATGRRADPPLTALQVGRPAESRRVH